MLVRVETIHDIHARWKASKNAEREAKRLARKNAPLPVKIMKFLFAIAFIIFALAVIGSQK